MDASELPRVMYVRDEMRRGRNVHNGYQRGLAIMQHETRKIIEDDPDFKEALRLGGERTLVFREKLLNLFLLLKFYIPGGEAGHIVEFGSFKGGSAIIMAYLAEKFLPGTKVYAFDTFGGMPPVDDAVDWHREGDFRDTDLQQLRDYVGRIGLPNLHFVKGLFEDTAPTTLPDINKISLCHINCDIRSAVIYAYDIVQTHMTTAGYIVLDDPLFATTLGATEAVEEVIIQWDGLFSEQVFPHYVFRAAPKGHIRGEARSGVQPADDGRIEIVLSAERRIFVQKGFDANALAKVVSVLEGIAANRGQSALERALTADQ
jgi:hypothetical protein